MLILNGKYGTIKLAGTILFALIIANYAFCIVSYAAHPLITDDAGTQGKGKFLFELNGQLSYDKANSLDDTGLNTTTKSREGEAKAFLTYGAGENIDLVLGFPYQWKKTEVDDVTTSDVNGIADISLEVKWRFFEKEGLSFALKPGLTLPAGDKNKSLGTGISMVMLHFIATKEINPWAFHLNLGYKRNENKLEQREDIWHASLAGEVKVMQNLKFVANIGAERNTDKASQTNPAFILGGFIYSLRENLDIDIGVKAGLNETEKDYTYLGGTALRF